MKPLTEAQAWMVIAGNYGGVVNEWARIKDLRGLCAQTSRLFDNGLITQTTLHRMRARMDRSEPNHRGIWWWPLTYVGAEQRAAFCRKMAQDAQR